MPDTTPEKTEEELAQDRERAQQEQASPSPAAVARRDAETEHQRYQESIKDDVLGETFVPPLGAQVAERDAKNRPVVYQRGETRFYTPYSDMWQKGYRNDEEYRQVQRVELQDKSVEFVGGEASDSGKPAPHPSAQNITQRELELAERLIPGFASMNKKEQFNALVDGGRIEQESRFAGGEGKNWSYYPAIEFERVEALRKREPLEKHLETRRAEQEQAQKDFELKTIKLKDGQSVSISDFNELEEKYRTIGLREGFEAMNRAIEQENYAVREQNAKALRQLEASLVNLPPDIQEAYKTGGFEGVSEAITAYNKKIEDSQKSLEPYKKEKGYDVIGALIDGRRKPQLAEAVEFLFPRETLDKIKRENSVALTIGTGKPKEVKPVQPSQEKVGLLKSIAPLVLVGGPIAAAEPTPFGEIALAVLLAGIALVAGPKETRQAISDSLARLRKERGQPIKAPDLTIITADGRALPVDPEWLKQPIPPFISRVPTEKAIPPIRGRIIEGVKEQLKPPDIAIPQEQIIPPKNVAVIYLPTPRSDIQERMGGVISAQRLVDTSEAKLRVATQTIPIDWDRILEAATRKKLEKALSGVSSLMGDAARNKRLSEAQVKAFGSSRDNYLRRKLLLEEAKRQYVASLNPTPVVGKDSSMARLAFANFYLQNKMRQITKGRASVKARDLTIVQAETLDETRIKTASRTATQTATQAQIKIQTQTKARARAATRTATQTATKTAAKTATRTLARTATLTARIQVRIRKTPPLVKHLTIEPIKSAIAFRQGALGRGKRKKSVTIALIAPYRSIDKVVFVGRTPKGMKVAPSQFSAYKSVQVLRGVAPGKVKTRIGFQQLIITKPRREPGGGRRVMQYTPTRYHSRKVSQLFITKIGKSKVLSRRPL